MNEIFKANPEGFDKVDEALVERFITESEPEFQVRLRAYAWKVSQRLRVVTDPLSRWHVKYLLLHDRRTYMRLGLDRIRKY